MSASRDLRCLWNGLGVGLILSTLLTGCMVPTYHQPQGFSSTYYQELQKVTAANPTPGLGPTAVSSARIGGPKDVPPVLKPIETTEPPQELAEAPAAEGTGSWWSWIRRPLTFRSAQQADSSADEEENDADEPPVRR